jgi:hypothetical protein
MSVYLPVLSATPTAFKSRHVENIALSLAAIDVLDWQWRKRTGHGLHNYRSFDSFQH